MPRPKSTASPHAGPPRRRPDGRPWPDDETLRFAWAAAMLWRGAAAARVIAGRGWGSSLLGMKAVTPPALPALTDRDALPDS
jgi:hypothetical protein